MFKLETGVLLETKCLSLRPEFCWRLVFKLETVWLKTGVLARDWSSSSTVELKLDTGVQS